MEAMVNRNIPLYPETLLWLCADQNLLSLPNAACLLYGQQMSGLTQIGIEPTTFHTHCVLANHLHHGGS